MTDLKVGQRIDIYKVTNTDMPVAVPNGKHYASIGFSGYGPDLVGEFPCELGWYLRAMEIPEENIYPECVKVGTMVITALK